jgi:2,5-furandicarboxylate decarboxylase 1
MDLRDLIERLEGAGVLVQIERAAAPCFELAGVAHALEGRPVLFRTVAGFPGWRVVSGTCSDRSYLALALGIPPDRLLPTLARAVTEPKDPPLVSAGACQQVVMDQVDLNRIPILHHLSADAGPYVTAGVLIVDDPEYGRNMAYHRLLRLGRREFATRLVENRGTDSAWRKTEGDLPCAICIGVPLQVNLAAAIAPPAGVDELGIAQALVPTPLVRCLTSDLAVPAEAEVILEGRITKRTAQEGPFPDLTGTLDGVRHQPVIEIDRITHRRDPIYHALLPAGLEHRLLMGMPREPTIMTEVDRVAHCTDVVITPGGASWLHAVVQIDKRDPADGRRAIEAAFRGHGSLKHVVVVDTDVDIHDSGAVEWAIATRFQADRDLVILEDQPGSSLDPSRSQQPGQKARTAKLGLDATVPWGADPADFDRVRYPSVDLDAWLPA